MGSVKAWPWQLVTVYSTLVSSFIMFHAMKHVYFLFCRDLQKVRIFKENHLTLEIESYLKNVRGYGQLILLTNCLIILLHCPYPSSFSLLIKQNCPYPSRNWRALEVIIRMATRWAAIFYSFSFHFSSLRVLDHSDVFFELIRIDSSVIVSIN